MSQNPLQRYFRQPSLYLTLPSMNRWYTATDIAAAENGEVAVYGLTAIDDIMLNTPDAMLNGQALEKVISNCVPSIKNVKSLLLPDLDAIFVAIKLATTGQGYPMDRNCPKCAHDNTQDLNCQHVLDNMTFVDNSDCSLELNELKIFVRPYTFEMRHIFMQRQFEEQNLVNQLSTELDDFARSKIIAESVERLSRITYELVSRSVEKIQLPDGNMVTDHDQIKEWLFNITSSQAEAVINQVTALNQVGVQKTIQFTCAACAHEWSEQAEFDPISFFGKR